MNSPTNCFGYLKILMVLDLPWPTDLDHLVMFKICRFKYVLLCPLNVFLFFLLFLLFFCGRGPFCDFVLFYII